MPDPGVDTYILDEALAGSDPTSTDSLFLLSPDGPATPTPVYSPSDLEPESDTLTNQLTAYYIDGGKSVIVQGYGDGTTLPEPTDAIDLLPAGAGQVVAPELVASDDLVPIIDKAWNAGKVVLCNGTTADTDTTLSTLAQSIISTSLGGRGAALFADIATYSVPGQPPATFQVPASISVAAMIARQDLLTGNPGDAAAGVDGISNALGVLAERSTAARSTLKTAQVNTFRTVQGTLRNYGIRTLADLTNLPLWWDFWASRTIMALRQRCNAVAEDFVFQQIDGDGVMIGRFNQRITDECKALQDAGAIYGNGDTPGYVVTTDDTVNTTSSIQAGQLTAKVQVKCSPHAEHITVNLIREALN